MARMRVTRGTGLLERFLSRQRAKVANVLIPRDRRDGCILDLGCGSYPLFLTQIGFARKIGMDRVAGSVLTEYPEVSNIRLVHHDFVSNPVLPIKSHSCTVVTMLAVVEHMEPHQLEPLLHEIRRVLEPAGILIITTPAAWTDLVLRAMARVRLVSPIELSEHKAAYDRALLRSMLQKVFPQEGLQTGLFELGMNIWATARKPSENHEIDKR